MSLWLLVLCTGVQSCWNRMGPSLTVFHIGSIKLSWYTKALEIPFSGTKGSRPAPENSLPPQSPHHQTLLGIKQSYKHRSPGLNPSPSPSPPPAKDPQSMMRTMQKNYLNTPSLWPLSAWISDLLYLEKTGKAQQDCVLHLSVKGDVKQGRQAHHLQPLSFTVD